MSGCWVDVAAIYLWHAATKIVGTLKPKQISVHGKKGAGFFPGWEIMTRLGECARLRLATRLWRTLGSWIKGIEAEVAALNHVPCKGRHDRSCLHMQVAEHGVGAPATDKTNGVFVDVGTQKCHGTAGTEGAGFDVRGTKPIIMAVGRDKVPQQAGDGAGV